MKQIKHVLLILISWQKFTGVEQVNASFDISSHEKVTYVITYQDANFSTRQNLFAPAGEDNSISANEVNLWVDSAGTRVFGWAGVRNVIQATGLTSLNGDHEIKVEYTIVGAAVTANLFVDGNIVYTNSSATNASRNSTGIGLGFNVTAFPQGFTGKMSEVKILGDADELLLRYYCNEFSGTTAIDSSGSGFDGVINLGGSSEASFFTGP